MDYKNYRNFVLFVFLHRAAPKLKDVILSESKARELYLQCVHLMRTLFQECRLVHADLSEFNMLYVVDFQTLASYNAFQCEVSYSVYDLGTSFLQATILSL